VTNDTTITQAEDRVFVNEARHSYSPRKHQHNHHHQDHTFFPPVIFHSVWRRDWIQHVWSNHKKNLVVAQKQLANGMILSLVLMAMFVVWSTNPLDDDTHWYFSSSSSTKSSLPRLPPLLLTTPATPTSDVKNHPLAMSARDTQKLLQKINHASASASTSSTITTTATTKKKNHQHQHHHEHFTLRLQGSRVDLLHMALDQHATCPGVAHVQIDWTGPVPFVAARQSDIIIENINDESSSMTIDQQEQAQSNNDAASAASAFVPFTLLHHASRKVGPVEAATTHAALLLMHERVSSMLSCDDLTRSFVEWKNAPTRLVGFFPLLQPPPPPQDDAASSLRSSRKNHHIDGDDNMLYPRPNYYYSLLSDRAVFVHKLYLPEALRYVLRQESSHICREYMLAARIAAISNQTPVAMTLLQNHHHHHHFEEDNVLVHLDSSRRMKEMAEYDNDRLDCLPLLLEAVGQVSLPATDAVYVGRDVRIPRNSSSGGGSGHHG
jgi:Glycosyl transferase family 64 domain